MIVEVNPETLQIHIQNLARRDAFAAQPDGRERCGRSGAIPVGPLFAQALEDALHDLDFEIFGNSAEFE